MYSSSLMQSSPDWDGPRPVEDFLPLVYGELRALAAARLADERPGQTLQATALVHEAYLRLACGRSSTWDNRGHFFAAAAEAMRRILIERARKRVRRQRLVGTPLALDQLNLATPPPDDLLLALDEALGRLATFDPPAANLIKLRFYAGLTVPQAAEALDMPLRTAERNWTFARTWLHRYLQGNSP